MNIKLSQGNYRIENTAKTVQEQLDGYHFPAYEDLVRKLTPLAKELDNQAVINNLPFPLYSGIKYLVSLYNFSTHCKAFKDEETCRTMYSGFGSAGARLPYYFLNTESELYHCIKPRGLNFINKQYHRCEKDWFVMNICTEDQWQLIELF